jgi:hypothetical protein
MLATVMQERLASSEHLISSFCVVWIGRYGAIGQDRQLRSDDKEGMRWGGVRVDLGNESHGRQNI